MINRMIIWDISIPVILNLFFENFIGYNSSVIKFIKQKEIWRNMPLQRG